METYLDHYLIKISMCYDLIEKKEMVLTENSRQNTATNFCDVLFIYSGLFLIVFLGIFQSRPLTKQ